MGPEQVWIRVKETKVNTTLSGNDASPSDAAESHTKDTPIARPLPLCKGYIQLILRFVEYQTKYQTIHDFHANIHPKLLVKLPI